MRKRVIATVCVALLCTFALVLTGCGQQAPSEEPKPEEPTTTTDGKDEPKEAVTTTMADYLHEHYASFDTFDEGIKSGESIPVSLRLFVTDKTDGYVYDKATIVELWNQLSAVKIDLENPTKDQMSGDAIVFDFDSGRELIPFPFKTYEYADFGLGELYAVQNPEEVRALVDRVAKLAAENMPKAGDELVDQNGAYLWDADGDGMLEHMWLDFNNNGDEAPSGYSIRLFNAKYDLDAYLDNTHEISSVVLQQDDGGYYVVLKTDNGDHTVRLVKGELVVE